MIKYWNWALIIGSVVVIGLVFYFNMSSVRSVFDLIYSALSYLSDVIITRFDAFLLYFFPPFLLFVILFALCESSKKFALIRFYSLLIWWAWFVLIYSFVSFRNQDIVSMGISGLLSFYIYILTRSLAFALNPFMSFEVIKEGIYLRGSRSSYDSNVNDYHSRLSKASRRLFWFACFFAGAMYAWYEKSKGRLTEVPEFCKASVSKF